jgi:hypothetical protein
MNMSAITSSDNVWLASRKKTPIEERNQLMPSEEEGDRDDHHGEEDRASVHLPGQRDTKNIQDRVAHEAWKRLDTSGTHARTSSGKTTFFTRFRVLQDQDRGSGGGFREDAEDDHAGEDVDREVGAAAPEPGHFEAKMTVKTNVYTSSMKSGFDRLQRKPNIEPRYLSIMSRFAIW